MTFLILGLVVAAVVHPTLIGLAIAVAAAFVEVPLMVRRQLAEAETEAAGRAANRC